MTGFSIRSLVSFTSSNIHSYIPLCDRCNSLSLPNTEDSDKTHKNDVNTVMAYVPWFSLDMCLIQGIQITSYEISETAVQRCF